MSTPVESTSGVKPRASSTKEDAAAPSPPRIPDHELLRLIGRGSYGEVWLARNSLGRLRAVKIVRRAAFDDARPFEREFEGIRQFEPISRSHEGLVDILQVGGGGESDYFYYVMELADRAEPMAGAKSKSMPSGSVSQSGAHETQGRAGSPAPSTATDSDSSDSYAPRTLRSDLQGRTRLPISECIPVAMGLASALNFLHERGLVHRDLKPANIIFVEGQPKLADIGLVARAEEAESLVGTLGFIPPEGSGTARADLFSLGKVLYEMSTGKDRREFPQLPPNLREFPDAAPLVEFNEIVLKACAHDPAQRYASASEVRADLALLHGGRSVRRLRAMERRLVVATRAGLALAALLAVAGGFYWAARHQAETNARLAAANAALAATNAQLAAHTVQQLYAAELNLAFQAWDGGNVPRARALLERQRGVDPALRGFEWSLLSQLCDESDARFVLAGHTGTVWSVAVSRDDRRLVTAGVDGFLKVWDTATGACVTNLAGFGKMLHATSFSPDGQTLASGGRDFLVTLWDWPSGKIRRRLIGHRNAIRTLAFSADGRHLASAGEDAQIRIWRVDEGTEVARLDEDMSIETVSFSADGRWLAAAGTDANLHLWDVDRRTKKLIAPQLSHIKAVAFAPTGPVVAAAGYDGLTELWDVARGESLGPLGSGAPVVALSFSYDGQWLAAAGADAGIHLWNIPSRQPVRQLRGHTGEVNALAYSHDGTWLASASHDGSAYIWDLQPPSERRHTLVHTQTVTSVAFARDGRHLATAHGRANAFDIWESATGAKVGSVKAEPDAIWCLAYESAPEGGVLFSGGIDGSLRRWDVRQQRMTHSRRVYQFAIDAITVSPDGRFVATGCRGGPVQLWETAALEPVATLPGLPQTTRGVAFSPNGRWLAASGRTPQVSVWDVARRALDATLPGHQSEVRAVAFSPDNAFLATADDGRAIRFWSTGSWKMERRFEGHDAPIKSLSFTPDGRTLASGSEDGTVKLWNLALAQEVATLRGHRSEVRQIAFSPDGSLLATAGGDGIVRLWRADQSARRNR
jgi:WD40 repeat protein